MVNLEFKITVVTKK